MSKIYDIETYPNFFCTVFMDNKGGFDVFEISARKNQIDEFYKYLVNFDGFQIGFNNVRFDAQCLQYIIEEYQTLRIKKGSDCSKAIYLFAQEVIDRSNRWIKPIYPEYKLENDQIDLYLINHYNNKNKATSLKWLEFSMDWYKVQDLPIKHGQNVKLEHFDSLIEYCKNDVLATHKFASKSKKLVKLRLDQEEQYPDLNLRNKSDSSVGELIFLHELADAMGVKTSELRDKRTHYDFVRVKECILPYVKFESEEFNSILEKFKDAVVVNDDDDSSFATSVMYNGIEYVYGEGGLHASYHNKIFEADDEYVIQDFDVKSYYPNLAIKNRFKPKHLPETFCDVYEAMYNKRASIPKSDPQNYSLKISLNGVYGKSKDRFSFLYDKKFQLKITVNGQLLLTMLAEKFSKVENCTVIQANTDGVTVKYKRSDKELIRKIADEWMTLTDLELEDVEYSKMVIKDVNNYIAVYKDGGYKYKGKAFEIDPDFHKNKSQRIVRIALKRFFVDGIPVEQTIKNHMDVEGYDWNEEEGKYDIEAKGIYDFCIGQKIRSNQNYTIVSPKETVKITDKVIRYYISKGNTTRLVKNFSDGRKQAVNKGYNVTLMMDKKDEEYNLDFQYYIAECNKVITPILGGNEQIGFSAELF